MSNPSPVTFVVVAFLAGACGGDSSSASADAGPDGSMADAAVDASPDATPGVALTGPAQIKITCGVAIPVDGKADCQITIGTPEGLVVYQGPVGVGLHGRSSLGFPKKQYAIELRNPDGSDHDVDLFGMGADADWLLNGAWLDRGLIRNKLAYDLHRAMGGSAPDSRFAELTLDGAALGVFLLVERVERGAERVNIAPDDGTGSSFIAKGSQTGVPTVLQANPWEVVYPKVPPAGVATRVATIESAIMGGTDAMFDQVDLASLVDFVILEETVKNNDAYFLSHHLYVGAGGKAHFLPWDLDLTVGQPSYNDNELANQWILYRPLLISLPAARPMFRAALAARWAELRTGVLATDQVIARIEGYRTFLGPAIASNWAIWDITQPQNTPGFPLYAIGSPRTTSTAMEAFLTTRLAWIDANIAAY